jgi:hypothetical protein
VLLPVVRRAAGLCWHAGSQPHCSNAVRQQGVNSFTGASLFLACSMQGLRVDCTCGLWVSCRGSSVPVVQQGRLFVGEVSASAAVRGYFDLQPWEL